ncbi:PilC/PilY family type IV pilus protein [Wohlfahrtiimonas chitiniclastica]|uniref:PilC/PilY family type IV pilus protein n=1 Tax=Wohlfahrtiimonas chitiniclastica TaxID=400946 RepID=UPI0007B698F9|nr:PilC/PilY family type IV pilus protein [Wohlfahrtiimonas chitiniclastica]KZX36776.1 hypothetical protein A6V30_07600 [Wohlfahrtiimonas chitiniclastica]
MKQQTLLIKMLLALAPVAIGSLAFSEEKKEFVPSTEPVFNTPQAKPNILMVLDDSGSMGAPDIEMAGYRNKVTRKDALSYTVEALLNKYREKAYLGISFLNKWGPDGFGSVRNQGGLRLKMDDYSKLSEAEFKQVTNYVSNLILEYNRSPTPVRPAVYEAIKMFRGQAAAQKGSSGQPDTLREGGIFNRHQYFDYAVVDSPLRYRCQENHMIVMTDGEPNGDYAYGVVPKDIDEFISGSVGEFDRQSKIIQGVDLSKYVNLRWNGAALGKIAANTDLRNERKEKCDRNGKCYQRATDDAGKPWNDSYSMPMPIKIHTVSLFVDPKDQFYTDLTKAGGGMNLGFKQNEGTAEDLLTAFDTIFSTIIRSTSSTKAMNDRTQADVLVGAPTYKNGKLDLSKVGTIRYDTTYNFRQRFGSIRALVPYISSLSGKDGKPDIATTILWDTNEVIKPGQGQYVTLNYPINTWEALLQLEKVYQQANPKSAHTFDQSYLTWLVDFSKTTHPHNLRARLNPMGSVTNSDIQLANKDMLYINIDNRKMGSKLREELKQWLFHKARYQPVNHLIVGDNDGFINFINAQRGLSNGYQAGERNTAYFPTMLAARIDEIAKADKSATLVMEGRTNLVDAKVNRDTYATIGLTSMGSGGKGLVGYSIMQGTMNNGHLFSTEHQKKVQPLFEITNEGPESLRTEGFKNLGYTYSGFEFFNRVENGQAQAVAVFGNGFGAKKSSIYFIDAYTGKKLHEIILSPNGGGASTPSMLISADDANGQKIDRIYVGDYSGTLYRIDFNSKGFKSGEAKVTALFKAPMNNFGQSAISIKPLLLKAADGVTTVYFGTGMAASHELDRGQNSLVEHSMYAVKDRMKTSERATATVDVLRNQASSLTPLLQQENLSAGRVGYPNNIKPNYMNQGKYEIDIQVPVADVSATTNGWYMRLIADGEKSGERIIHEPKYDAKHDAVIFTTWGVYEREGGQTINGLDDPCLSDAAFGKTIAVNSKTGSASRKIPLTNKATTNNASSGLTGDNLLLAPEGNSMTDINSLSSKEASELIAVVGEKDSTHATDDENYAAYCDGDLTGRVECVLFERDKLLLDKQRIGIQKIFSF